MKFFLVAAMTSQLLFVVDTFAQNELKEKLKGLENNTFALDSESKISLDKEVKLTTEFDDLQLEHCLDSVISFVVVQKEMYFPSLINLVVVNLADITMEQSNCEIQTLS